MPKRKRSSKGSQKSLAIEERFTDLDKHPETAFSGSKAKLIHGHNQEEGEWLKSQPAYTLFRPAPHKKGVHQRAKIVTSGIDEQWQADLADMSNWQRENKGYRYILTVLDVMSRFAFARPIKHKNGQEVAEALEDIFTESKRHPKFYLQTDEGKEFFNKHVKELASKYGFSQFHTYDRDIKAAMVERFNRTLKEMIWRYFTWTNTRKWVTNSQREDMLAKFVNAYNHRQHTTLGMSPLQAMKHDQNELYDSTIGKHLKWKQRKRLERDYSNIKVGDFVLVNTAKKTFEKGVAPKWTREVFKVINVDMSSPRLSYKLEDMDGEEVKGMFVSNQLQKVTDPTNQPLMIEKVVKRRGDQVLVKYLGNGDKFNTWVHKSQVKDL